MAPDVFAALGPALELARKVLEVMGFLSPWFYAAVGAVLLLELAIPANRNQRLLSRGFGWDVAWLFVGLAGRVALLVPFVTLLKSVYETHLSFLAVEALAAMPELPRVVVGVLITDLLAWVHHWVRHKVAWPFHAVHHSQPELNLFTDERNHVVDLMVSAGVRIIPMLALQVQTPTIVAWTIVATWYTRLYHANLRTNFGWLRYVLVTPQSHRIHHSPDPRHRDKNFGLLFSIWDHAFGTQWRGYDEYPETGIAEADFPLEQGRTWWQLPATLVRQQLHPFVVAARGLRRRPPAQAGYRAPGEGLRA